MTLHQAKQQLLAQLYPLYDNREAANIADWVLEHLTGWSRIDRVLHRDALLSSQQIILFEKYLVELSAQMPVQYVLKEAWFAAMKFLVNEHTLIPRPETEELVELVVKYEIDRVKNLEHALLLDVGTGSGCIPIALKKKMSSVKIISCDISADALEVASYNAQQLGANIELVQADFLNPTSRAQLPVVDVLVSNPPYIPLRDKESMDNHVVLYEPSEALFVENSVR